MSTSIVPLGLCHSLQTIVQSAETLLGRAEMALTTLRSTHNSDYTCNALVQLDQVLLDGRDYVQREYDHISNTYGSESASKGDETSKCQFWMICTNIETQITRPLEGLSQEFLSHQNHHGHEHGHSHVHHHHCHFCRAYYYHHHHSRSVRFSGIGVMVAKGSHNHDHHHLSEYEGKFHEMSNNWSGIKGNVSSCFDELGGRLKKKKDDGASGSKPPDKTVVQHNKVREVFQEVMRHR